MNGRWLSAAPVLWALYDAPAVPARLVSTLVAVALHASDDGRGAYPSGASVGLLTRKSESQAKRDMAELEKRGLLIAGDQKIVAHIRADRRPKVYDLPMPRGASERAPSGPRGVAQDTPSRGASGQAPSGPRGAYGNTTGRISAQNGGRPDAPEEFLKNSRTARAPARRAGGARPAHAKPFRAPPCPVCGRPFSAQLLADPDMRAAAMAGTATHGDIDCRTPACHADDHEQCAVAGCHCQCHDPAMAAALPTLAGLLPGGPR